MKKQMWLFAGVVHQYFTDFKLCQYQYCVPTDIQIWAFISNWTENIYAVAWIKK